MLKLSKIFTFKIKFSIFIKLKTYKITEIYNNQLLIAIPLLKKQKSTQNYKNRMKILIINNNQILKKNQKKIKIKMKKIKKNNRLKIKIKIKFKKRYQQSDKRYNIKRKLKKKLKILI